MVAYLLKSNSSEGFNQIIDFLNGSSIKYALIVNSNIYVSCIKQFWTTVAVKKVNDVIRLQALFDKKKVMVMEATIRDALCLDDEEGFECLPNEEIFCIRAKKTSWNEFSSSIASAVICLSSSRKFNFSKKQVGNLSTHTTKYTSHALTQKVFANRRRVGKGFSRVETPLFEEMLVALEVEEGDDDEAHGEDVNAGDAVEGDVNAANDEVPTITEEPSIPSPTPPTPPQQPSHDIPSTSQERMIVEMDQDADVVLEDDKEVADDVKHVQDDIDESAQDQGRKAESQAEIYKIVLEHANKFLSMQKDEFELAKVQEVVDVVTTAKIIAEVVTAASETITAASINITVAEAEVPTATLTVTPARVTTTPNRRRKGVVIRDPQEESTTSTIISTKTKSKDKAQARKNMMLYLKNVAGFKMDYFKGMYYDDICPIFEAKFNKNMAFLQKKKEKIEEEEVSRALKRLNKTPADKAAKRQKLDEEVEELKRHLQIVPNKDDDVCTEATLLARKVPIVDYEIIK
uniref:Xylulose kinase-1 n=1 Tax=Tanacetum cinerariifolium TaxID=118510 RepID=A0A699IYU9_TANCI|nr:hypothetical protein [Tanacetum cinerariifolium]